jgi:aminomethyltransferase
MTDDRRSPLHDVQEAAGAEFYWEDGWPWAMKFSDDVQREYEAIRTGTGLWDLFSTIKYEVRGPDAGRFVQRRATNDLSTMQVGQVRYAAFVNADGLMVDDGNTYKLADDRYWVMINSAELEEWFRESGGDLDATVEDVTERNPMISIQGPTSRDVLGSITEGDLSSLGWFRFSPEPMKVAGADALVLRTGFSGELGFEVVTDPGSIEGVWNALVEAGGTPFGLDAVDLARVEAGLIIIAIDYQPGETSPWDLSMDRFIKTDTENVGAKALAEVGAAPQRRFKTLRIEADAPPEAGAEVTKDGEPVGTVTSPAASPRLGTIGLAILRTDAATDGEKVEVAVEGGTAPATVDVLSLYDPQKQKPRS